MTGWCWWAWLAGAAVYRADVPWRSHQRRILSFYAPVNSPFINCTGKAMHLWRFRPGSIALLVTGGKRFLSRCGLLGVRYPLAGFTFVRSRFQYRRRLHPRALIHQSRRAEFSTVARSCALVCHGAPARGTCVLHYAQMPGSVTDSITVDGFGKKKACVISDWQ